jgi:hypothetical protein
MMCYPGAEHRHRPDHPSRVPHSRALEGVSQASNSKSSAASNTTLSCRTYSGLQPEEYEKLGSYALIGLPMELYKKR